MPTEVEIQKEIIDTLTPKADADKLAKVKFELDEFTKRDGLDGKPCIQKLYSQWKSGKQGNMNAHNSWTAYLLGMTTKAPTGEFKFEKRRAFARPSPPDIDSDFEYERRQEVIDDIVKQYGRERVGNIGTYGALKMRSALTRIIKALDIADAFHKGSQVYTTDNVKKVDEILGKLPKQYGAVLKVKDEQGEEQIVKNTKDAYKYVKDFRFYMDKYPEIMKHAANVEGLLSIFSVHASGIVISDVPLAEIAPLKTAKVSGDEIALATQFAYEDLEELGLIKFDILAISTLSVISRCVKMIKQNYGIDVDIENLPLDDKPTLALYKSGALTGVFQCESTGMQSACVQMGIDRFDDIIALISLYRPGPMEHIPTYCAVKHGEQKASYFHKSVEPFIKPFLETTYGIPVYQEDIMRICCSLAGFTLTEGYQIIKAIGKKKPEIMNPLMEKFVAGCMKNGIDKDVASQFWHEFIVKFAGYGFNKAHACAYAYLSWQTAHLKANFPEEFICSYLNVETIRRKLDRVFELEQEAFKMGITILPRDLNKCGLEYEIVRKRDTTAGIEKSEIRPTIHCKGLPTAAAEDIVKNRPYTSIRDLAEKTDMSLVDKESIMALCDAGFFRTKKDKIINDFEVIREDIKSLRKKGRQSGNIFDE